MAAPVVPTILQPHGGHVQCRPVTTPRASRTAAERGFLAGLALAMAGSILFSAKAIVITELTVWRLKIANTYWRNRIFLIGDFEIFEALEISSKPIAIAGTSFFQTRDFIIDFARKRLLVKSRK